MRASYAEGFRTPDNYAVFKFTWTIPSVADLFVGARYTGAMKVPHYAGAKYAF